MMGFIEATLSETWQWEMKGIGNKVLSVQPTFVHSAHSQPKLNSSGDMCLDARSVFERLVERDFHVLVLDLCAQGVSNLPMKRHSRVLWKNFF